MSVKEIVTMRAHRTVLAMAAMAMLAAVPSTPPLAQAQVQTPVQRPTGTYPEVRARLVDGRMAMIREALRLDEPQLKLWAPVEAQLRAQFAARQQARAERRERRRQDAVRPSLPDRLDRRSKRLAERAERAKALAEAFRPFYASLGDDQKEVAALVLRRPLRGIGRHAWHRLMRRAADVETR
jgi:hypothetical protein